MLAWADLDSCRLRFLREALDDELAADCGRCDRCTDQSWQNQPDPGLVAKAAMHLQGGDVVVEPRKQWPTRLDEPKGRIKPELQVEPGRALARLGDGGWDATVEGLFNLSRNGLDFELPEDLVQACAGVLKRWDWVQRPTWICPMPSRRTGSLINAVADAIGALGKLPVHRVLSLGDDSTGRGLQADQANSAHQVLNVWSHLVTDMSAMPEQLLTSGPVLVIDDEMDSRWTMTVAGYRLRQAGIGPVLPFALRSRL